MKNRIISFLLHHANKGCKQESFYNIKNRLLKDKPVVRFDIQHIAGKKCHSCGGRGAHPRYGYNGKIYDWADCYHCWGGWYRLPKWNILRLVKFGKYYFHQPVSTVYDKPKLTGGHQHIIEGYIEKESTDKSELCLDILYLFYNRKALQQRIKLIGRTYYFRWNTPKKIIHNIIYVIRHGKDSYPIKKLLSRIYKTKPKVNTFAYADNDDLPF